MRPFHPLILSLIALTATMAAADEDYFAFIPEGGRTMLQRMLTDDPGLAARLQEPKTAADWLADLTGGRLGDGLGLDEWQARTLADYLAYAAPIDPAALPDDGRDMTLARCQSCHIVTVVVTQARAKEAWLGTMGKPSHVGVALSTVERDQLADYLTVNAGLPIDAIPPELRAGGASY